MLFGMYAPTENASAMKVAGWDFVEGNIIELLQGELTDDQWQGAARAVKAPIPLLAANRLLPPHIKPVGPTFDLPKLQQYMQRVISRAARIGMKTLVFGSGVARTVPAGFDRASARDQLLDFIRMSTEIAAKHGVLIVAEPLNRAECNIMNGVPECMEYVRAVNHPNFQCLVDSYHVWLDNDPLEPLTENVPWLKHVHVSDVENRNVPSPHTPHDYQAFFNALKKGGYDGPIAVESPTDPRVLSEPAQVLQFVNQRWNDA